MSQHAVSRIAAPMLLPGRRRRLMATTLASLLRQISGSADRPAGYDARKNAWQERGYLKIGILWLSLTFRELD